MEQKNKQELPKAFAALIESNVITDRVLKYGAGETELIIKINPQPSVSKRTEAIELATDLVFSFESGADGYITSLLTFARKYAVLMCFTDIEFSFKLNDIWALVNATSLYDDVVKEVGEQIVSEFTYELNELIDANKGSKVQSINVDSILTRLNAMVNGISEQFKNIDLPKVLKGFSKLPKDFKGEDLIKQIIAVAKGGG